MAIVFNPNSNSVTVSGVAGAGPITATINGCTAGNTLLLAVTSTDSPASVGIAPPTAPAGWTRDSFTNSLGGTSKALWVAVYRKTASAGSNSFSAAFSSGTSPYYWIGSLTEVTPLALDKAPTPVSSATTSLTGPNTGTLSSATEFVLGICGSDDPTLIVVPTLPAGFTTILGSTGGGTNIAVLTAYQITSATTAINPTWTSTSSDILVAAITTYTDAAAPVITVQPTQQSAASGSTATFAVTATGTGSLSYLWYNNGVSTGGTASSYTTPTLTNADNGEQYYCEVTDSIGTTTTATVYLFIIGESSADGDKINSAWFTR